MRSTAVCHPDRQHFAKGLCRRCYYRDYMSRWRKKNPEAWAAIAQRTYRKGIDADPGRNRTEYLKRREQQLAQKAAAYAADPEKHRARRRVGSQNPALVAAKYARKRDKTYGLAPGEYDALLEAQGRACAICRTTVPGAGRSWAVDHDHKTGRVRGLLCARCNLAIGGMGDDPELLRAAADYVEATR
jgi:hypothetical protein